MKKLFVEQVLPRLAEPSTWIGIAALASKALGPAILPPDLVGPLSTVLGGLAAIAAVLLRERRA